MKILFVYAQLLICTCFYSQLSIQNNVLGTSGNSFSYGSFVMDFTLGETFTTTVPLELNYLCTQGFHQPTSIHSGAFLSEFLVEGFEVYPNPFKGELEIRIPENTKLEILFYDNAGRLVYTSQLSAIQTAIDLSHLDNANYHLVLKSKEKVIGHVSLIKSP